MTGMAFGAGSAVAHEAVRGIMGGGHHHGGYGGGYGPGYGGAPPQGGYPAPVQGGYADPGMAPVQAAAPMYAAGAQEQTAQQPVPQNPCMDFNQLFL